MEIAIFWFIGAIIVGIIAGSKGRTGFGYFILSLIISPLLAGILVLALGSTKPAPVVVAGEAASPETHVRCPECRELVRFDARKCKHCGTALVPQTLGSSRHAAATPRAESQVSATPTKDATIGNDAPVVRRTDWS